MECKGNVVVSFKNGFLMSTYMKQEGICSLAIYSGDRSHNHHKVTSDHSTIRLLVALSQGL